MSGNVAIQADAAPIVACTISRDVQNFDLLIEDMETELGEAWGDLSIDDAVAFFGQPEADTLEFVALAIDDGDEENLAKVAHTVKSAVEKGIKVVVIAEEVSPIALHQLLKLGAAEFVPYPLPEGSLHDVIERLRRPPPAMPAPGDATAAVKPKGDRDGVLFAVHGLAGGTGATTLATNLAWELTQVDKDRAPQVCLLDLDLQFGSVSTFLDLPRRDAVYELLSDTEAMDRDSFMQALLSYQDNLKVLTAPNDILPLDLISNEDVERLIEMARCNFDYVVIDMPSTVVQWTETVLQEAEVYFTTLELDMRSAQNALRMIKALKSEDLPVAKLRHVLNRAPKFTDLSGKSRVKRLAESLDISIELQMPDGLKPVAQAGDHGVPLADAAPKNALRREIQKLAKSLHEINLSEAVAQ
ncbi:Septum site-determining protein MinD [Aliiroseovarius sp. xm-m-379]|uniref:AAA family ATPase n=1 Tax=Aliiroseovarius TaxID=1658781 RepID=UPI001569F868|nr:MULTISPECIES: AAA family ATPase [Aliiroseovarius]NRP12364.1 Septum site-determining protein MinD [Aliiroseovarius sp. xm-d-517]NRP24738.1 Septum site-determining protein MinD [Aliiroseovarius sp. xm-m-379]NRP30627.1 Septum site-determining protein MinD [Aliiroseovarius sp. xm-m-314]NRP33537.1 Septum site-determining protein MinD [Aliiroseovarius sp. xm-a-104]NRP40644.1 Septum site-determining protein MinD [Aliiroseovarius sp. xm-m-339-2]